MIQGGCPEGTGRGGPGFTIKAEFNTTRTRPGVLSMARTTDPNSAGSQFFILLGKAQAISPAIHGFRRDSRRGQPCRCP